MPTNSVVSRIQKYLVKGLVIFIPAILTLFILSFVSGFIADAIRPLTSTLSNSLGLEQTPRLLLNIITVFTLLVIIFLVGFISELLPTAKQLTELFHTLVESIPGIGSVYSSFRKMSETMIQGENSFREVKLVEYPEERSYSIAFVTAGDNEIVTNSVGEKTTTLFVPMAPNPFMGGFVVNLPDDKVHDVDMRVRDGIKAVITSGTTLNPDLTDEDGNLKEELDDIEDMIK